MIELAQHIKALLLENDCVIVPGFGGFVTHYAPAMHIKEDNLFIPPTRTVGFNSQLKLNDGVLVQSYMSVHDTNFSDATRMIEKGVASLIRLLHEDGKAELENIGEIHYNIYGNYEFVPHDHKIATPFLYGLDSFEMQELASIQQKEKVLIPAIDLSKEKKTYEIRINRSLLRNAVAMVAAIVLFFAFSTPVENTYIQKNNYAQLLPCELFGLIEKQSVVVTPIANNKANVAAQHAKKTTATPQVSKTTKIAKPIVTKEIKVAKQKIAPVAVPVAKPQTNYPYHIIVAAGISLKDAEWTADQLKAKGFAGATALNNNGKIRVSICSFSERKEADKHLFELRKNEKYKNAWLLAK